MARPKCAICDCYDIGVKDGFAAGQAAERKRIEAAPRAWIHRPKLGPVRLYPDPCTNAGCEPVALVPIEDTPTVEKPCGDQSVQGFVCERESGHEGPHEFTLKPPHQKHRWGILHWGVASTPEEGAK